MTKLHRAAEVVVLFLNHTIHYTLYMISLSDHVYLLCHYVLLLCNSYCGPVPQIKMYSCQAMGISWPAAAACF